MAIRYRYKRLSQRLASVAAIFELGRTKASDNSDKRANSIVSAKNEGNVRTLLMTLIFTQLLCSCAFQRADVADKARAQLIGMSREQILSCMGVPQQKASEGQTEVWSYASGDGRRDTYAFGSGNAQGTANGNSVNAQVSSETFAMSRNRFCTVNIVMRGDTVTAVNYNGPTGGLLTQGEQCAYAVRACVR